MRIWFDLSNSPHINLFHGMIEELRASGHEVVITCRPLANTVDLLKLHGLPFEVIGEHYGARFTRKLGGYPVRVWQLYHWLKDKCIDVAISQSSFHSPVTGTLLGVRTVYMNDNEYALGNVPSFLFADRILVPQCLSELKLRRQLARKRKVLRYPGVKEGLYLWRLAEDIRSREPAGDGKDRPRVYVRPEPWTAQYYRGKLNFLDDLLVDLREFAQVTVLPRGAAQGRHYRQGRFSGISVVDAALDLKEIAVDCDLFIGAGGTMTREMAVLGIPTISVYQDELLDVDRYLLEQGAFVYQPSLTIHYVREFLESAARRPPNPVLLENGREAYDMVVKEITIGPQSK